MYQLLICSPQIYSCDYAVKINLSAHVSFGLQLLHGNHVLEEAAFQEAHLSIAIKPSLRIGQHQVQGDSKASHVNGEGTVWSPSGVETNHLPILHHRPLKLHSPHQTHRPNRDFLSVTHLRQTDRGKENNSEKEKKRKKKANH